MDQTSDNRSIIQNIWCSIQQQENKQLNLKMSERHEDTQKEVQMFNRALKVCSVSQIIIETSRKATMKYLTYLRMAVI